MSEVPGKVSVRLSDGAFMTVAGVPGVQDGVLFVQELNEDSTVKSEHAFPLGSMKYWVVEYP